MAIIIRDTDKPAIYAAYLALPTPKPSLGDFKTFVFEHGGIVVVNAMDPATVSKAAHGATDRRERRKHLR